LNNFENIEVLVEQLNPCLLMCSETCLTDNIDDNEINLIGYNLHRCDSHSRHTGGVLMYIRSNIKSEVIFNKSYGKNLWCLSVHVKCCALDGIYTTVYHSPNSSHAELMNYFENVIENCYDAAKLNIFVGDFNIDMSRNSTYSDKLKQIIQFHGMN
jgi:exonuclease III